MGDTCSTHGTYMHRGFAKTKGRHYMADLDIDGRFIINYILNIVELKMWTGFSWLIGRYQGGPL
jgi:hypothetical protein